MKNSHVRWLEEELPKLVEAEVLSAEDADRVGNYYRDTQHTSMMRVAIVMCSVLGACLIGSGIILLMAHNWEDLSRGMRTCISFSLLLSGQAVVGWTLWKKDASRAWREGSSAFLAMAIGTTIALIGQTYHIPGNLANFLFVWLLLSLPLVYLLRSTTVTFFYLIGVFFWNINAEGMGMQVLWYGPLLLLAVLPALYLMRHTVMSLLYLFVATTWLMVSFEMHRYGAWYYDLYREVAFFALLGGILPFLLHTLKHNRNRRSVLFMGWGFCASLCLGMGIIMGSYYTPGIIIISFASLFALLLLVGQTYYRDTPGQPFSLVGIVGTLFIALSLTFEGSWQEIMHINSRHFIRDNAKYYDLLISVHALLGVGILALVVVMCARRFRQQDYGVLAWMVSPVLVLIFVTLGMYGLENFEMVPMVLFNVYVFVLGVNALVSGVREGQLMLANGGMAIMALLFTLRFFDSDLGFVVRGIAFILIGVGFLSVNLLMARKEREHQGEVS